MGLRFRRSVRVGGARVNISKRGVSSISVGRPGSTLNLSSRGARATVGLPGTGLSYTTGRSGGAGAIIALIALAFGGVRLLIWLFAHAANGNRLAQGTLALMAGAVVYLSLFAPKADTAAPLVSATRPTIVQQASAAPISPTVAIAPQSAGLSDRSMRTTTRASMRSSPSEKGQVLGQLPPGSLVTVLDGQETWAKVHVDGRPAPVWVSWSLLRAP